MTSLPRNWTRATLRQLCVEAQPGFASGEHNQDGNGIIHLRPMNISSGGEIDLQNVRYVKDSPGRRVSAGDVLFNNTNSPSLVGKTALVSDPEPVAFSNHMTRLRVPDGISPGYLAMQLHWLWMSGYFRTVLSNHVNQASVARAELLETPIAVAPASEQMRIVAVLDGHLARVGDGMTAVQRASRLVSQFRAELLREAVSGRIGQAEGGEASGLREQVRVTRRELSRRTRNPLKPVHIDGYSLPGGWELPSLDELSFSSGYGTSTRCDYAAPGTAVLRIPNIRDGEVHLDDIKYAVDPSLDLTRFLVTPGDLLFIRTNGSPDLIGRIGVVRQNLSAAFASYLIRYRLVPGGVEPDWVWAVVNSPLWRSYIMDSSASSAGQYNLNATSLGQMPIPLPPLDEQRRILSEIDRLRTFSGHAEAAVSGAGSRSQGLRHSLFTAAFTGDLGTQDPSDEPAGALLDRIRAAYHHAHEPGRRRAGEPRRPEGVST